MNPRFREALGALVLAQGRQAAAATLGVTVRGLDGLRTGRTRPTARVLGRLGLREGYTALTRPGASPTPDWAVDNFPADRLNFEGMTLSGLVPANPQAALQSKVDAVGSQVDAAALLGISPQYLHDLLTGRRTFSDRMLGKLGLQRMILLAEAPVIE